MSSISSGVAQHNNYDSFELFNGALDPFLAKTANQEALFSNSSSRPTSSALRERIVPIHPSSITNLDSPFGSLPGSIQGLIPISSTTSKKRSLQELEAEAQILIKEIALKKTDLEKINDQIEAGKQKLCAIENMVINETNNLGVITNTYECMHKIVKKEEKKLKTLQNVDRHSIAFVSHGPVVTSISQLSEAIPETLFKDSSYLETELHR